MSALLDAALALEAMVPKLVLLTNNMAKEAATRIMQDLVLTTPVDVGTALSNWQVTLDTPPTDEIAAYAPSLKGKTSEGVWTHRIDPSVTRDANMSPTLETALAVIQSKQPGQDLYIGNVLPYISILDEGSSEQAPAGFAERALILVQSLQEEWLSGSIVG